MVGVFGAFFHEESGGAFAIEQKVERRKIESVLLFVPSCCCKLWRAKWCPFIMFMLRRVGPAITAGGVLAWKCHSHYEVRNICEDAPKRRNIAFATCEISANAPREDRAVHTDGLQGAGAFFLVLDGHGGWQVAEFAQNNLIPLVADELNGNVSSSLNNDKVVAEALVRGFERCDEAYAELRETRLRIGIRSDRSRWRACALLAYVDIVEDALRVACAGDCQAILGTDRGDAVQMSEEHNAVTKEAARIFSESIRTSLTLSDANRTDPTLAT